MRNLKKFLALALSASMALGMSMTSMAAETGGTVDAPIYAYDITNVVVPTTYVVAFNPNGLDVEKAASDIVQDQIISKNYGIINKSTKNKVITVTLEVEDLNEDKINFVDSAAAVTSASADDYAVNLTLVPADTTEIKIGGNSADETTGPAALADVTMAAATGKEISLIAGENDVDFLLEKAVYSGKIDLNSTTTNNVADKFNLTGLATGGKGITAFTLGGTMNAKADWTKLTKGIRITAIYDSANAPDGAVAETGTGALYKNPNPVFKTGSAIGTIKYKAGTGNDAVASITSITMVYRGAGSDGYNLLRGAWDAATDSNGLITFDNAYINYYIADYPDDEVREATVTYVTANGETKTTTVDVRLKEVVKTPSFSTGNAVGTINYVKAVGDDAIASITSITMDYQGSASDGYNASGNLWGSATDTDGLITFDNAYMQYYIDEYPTDTVRTATVTYETVGGATKTATVDVKLR
ncbi:MAG: hypothetical protein NC313_04050 [Butyrivibrio sp.]|nr:hypothetical protein [Butyrivibrio sp.]